MLISSCHRTFRSIPSALLLVCVVSSAAFDARAQSGGPGGLDRVCPLVEYERQRDVDDAETELELVENEYLARSKVFDMIERLWAARSIEREVYLDYKRLRDRTRIRIARLNTQIAQLETVVEQYKLTCEEVRGGPAERLPERVSELQSEYRRLDCELLAKDSEIADIDHNFDQQVLEATRTLAEGHIKSKYDLVIDEYDLSQSRARSESYRRRTTTCKERLEN